MCHKFESVTFVTLQNVTKCHKKTCDWYKLGYVLRFGSGSERLLVFRMKSVMMCAKKNAVRSVRWSLHCFELYGARAREDFGLHEKFDQDLKICEITNSG